MKSDEFTKNLTSPEYAINKQGWIVFVIAAAIIFFVALSIDLASPGDGTPVAREVHSDISAPPPSSGANIPPNVETQTDGIPDFFKKICSDPKERSYIEAEMKKMVWSRYHIDEVFGSDIEDGCYFPVVAQKIEGSYTRTAYIIWKDSTDDMIFFRDTSLTNGQNIEDIYKNAVNYLKGEENLRYTVKDWNLDY